MKVILPTLVALALASLALHTDALGQSGSSSKKKKASSSAEASPTPKPKPKSSPSPSGKPSATPKATATPKPSASPKGTPKAKSSPTPKASPTAKASPKPKATPEAGAVSDQPAPPLPMKTVKETIPPGALASSELAGFDAQPEKVRQLIEKALEISQLQLGYKYGSADPAQGGMDCSGAIYYLLGEQGFKNVPRDSSGQYVWARKNGKFFAVISKSVDSFELDELQPGDLMFWSGTYNIDRDPPITHTMIYLGREKKTKQPVMWGSSDGRSYEGKARHGVGVFDFKMPRAEGKNGEPQRVDFVGYARIPGLRSDETKVDEKTGAKE